MNKKSICVIGYSEYLNNVMQALDFDHVNVEALVTTEPDFFQNISSIQVDELISQYNLKCAAYFLDDLKKCVVNHNFDYYLLAVANGTEAIIKNIKKYNVKSSKILWAGVFSNEKNLMLTYMSKVKYITQSNVKLDFFVRGISYTKFGIDLNSFHPYTGVSLAEDSQDLFYSYEIAKYVLNYNENFKVALIGIAPYQFSYDLSMSNLAERQLQYYPIINKINPNYVKADVIKFIFNDVYKQSYKNTSSILQVDLNDSDNSKRDHNNLYPKISELINVKNEALQLGNKDYPFTIKENIKIIKKYIDLCKSKNVIPIGVVFPFSKALNRHYPMEELKEFQRILYNLKSEYKFNTINLLNLNLDYSHFWDYSHLNIKGANVVSKIIKNEIDKLLI